MMEAMTRAEQEMLLGRRSRPADGRRSPPLCRPRLPDHRRRRLGRLRAGAADCRCGPARLMLVDHSEHALFQVEQRLSRMAPPASSNRALRRHPSVSVSRLMRRVRPDIVFHAAAYKHVTMAERHAWRRHGQRARHAAPCSPPPGSRRAVRAHFVRQGGRAAQRHGRDQAVRGAGSPGQRRLRHAADRRPVRQRAGEQRQLRRGDARSHSPAASRCSSPTPRPRASS